MTEEDQLAAVIAASLDDTIGDHDFPSLPSSPPKSKSIPTSVPKSTSSSAPIPAPAPARTPVVAAEPAAGPDVTNLKIKFPGMI